MKTRKLITLKTLLDSRDYSEFILEELSDDKITAVGAIDGQPVFEITTLSKLHTHFNEPELEFAKSN